MSKIDPRIHPFRADLAAASLKGRVKAARFADSQPARIICSAADLRKTPSDDAPLDTQLCFGEMFDIYDEKNGWAWGQAVRDGYVGYIHSIAFDKNLTPATHFVAQRQAIIFAQPKATAQKIMGVGMGAELAIDESQNDQSGFVKIKSGGFIPRHHLRKIGQPEGDFVARAESLIGVPYLWGGRDTCYGIDCSALVQLSLQLCGISAPRDSDMQEAQCGQIAAAPLKRGDLIFWRAHVGIMLDQNILLHANAFHMAVASEKLSEAQGRIKKTEGGITAIKRL